MARVVNSQVKELLGRTEEAELDTRAFIHTASLLVDTHLLTAGLAAALLHEIELYLAAHFACIRDPLFMQGNTDGQSWTLQRGPAGDGLKATSYGQQVLLLDSTGILEQVNSRTKRISIKVF